VTALVVARFAAAGLILAGAAGLAAAVRLPLGASVGDGRAQATEEQPMLVVEVPDSLVARVVGGHPFRPDRRAAPNRYEPSPTGGDEVAAPPPVRPALRVAGLLWGNVPRVVLEGVPGREGGVILAVGDTAGGLRVRRLESGRAVIAGYDTTWVLTPRGLW
jgi:hypothetical protein